VQKYDEKVQFWLVFPARTTSTMACLGSGTKVLSEVFGFATVIAPFGSFNRKLVGIVPERS
jgi:hypothetical protein